MKAEERMLKALGAVDEEYIEEAAPRRFGRKGKRFKWWAVAACLCVAVLGGLLYYATAPRDFNTALANSRYEGMSELVLYCGYVEVGNRVARYEKLDLIDMDKLSGYVGELYCQTEAGSWYRPLGVDHLKYLFRQTEDGELSLWEFSDFIVTEGWKHPENPEAVERAIRRWEEQYPDADFSAYTYGEVYRTIYGVEGASEIASITAAPSTANGTDYGKQIQKEVGTHTYSDRETVEAFYSITADVLCYGEDVFETEWPMDNSRFTYSFSTDESNKLSSGEETYGTRYLTVTLKDGTTIDSWKYNALAGRFFEYKGIYTQPLSEDEVQTLNEIFGIH